MPQRRLGGALCGPAIDRRAAPPGGGQYPRVTAAPRGAAARAAAAIPDQTRTSTSSGPRHTVCAAVRPLLELFLSQKMRERRSVLLVST